MGERQRQWIAAGRKVSQLVNANNTHTHDLDDMAKTRAEQCDSTPDQISCLTVASIKRVYKVDNPSGLIIDSQSYANIIHLLLLISIWQYPNHCDSVCERIWTIKRWAAIASLTRSLGFCDGSSYLLVNVVSACMWMSYNFSTSQTVWSAKLFHYHWVLECWVCGSKSMKSNIMPLIVDEWILGIEVEVVPNM